MISKKFVLEQVLPHVKKESTALSYYMIASLYGNHDEDIIRELKKYQNDDKGFGNGLEADIQMPNSSAAATNIAIKALELVRDDKLKEPIIKDIVEYFENLYDEEKGRFFMATKEVDDYPHAVWWNFEDIASQKNFPFGNPDPEIIGFLYENRRFMKKLNFSSLINKVVNFIMSDKFMDAGMHSLMSVILFYKRVDDDVKNLIHDRIHQLVTKELNAALGKWDEYGLEPYKIYVLEPHFVNTHLEALGENLTQIIGKVSSLSVSPNWNWYQYEDVFEKVKKDWIGLMYFDMIWALRLHHIL